MSVFTTPPSTSVVIPEPDDANFFINLGSGFTDLAGFSSWVSTFIGELNTNWAVLSGIDTEMNELQSLHGSIDNVNLLAGSISYVDLMGADMDTGGNGYIATLASDLQGNNYTGIVAIDLSGNNYTGIVGADLSDNNYIGIIGAGFSHVQVASENIDAINWCYNNAGDIQTAAAGINAHINDATDAHQATAIGFTPSGDLTSTNVEDAINELDTYNSAHRISLYTSQLLAGDFSIVGGVLQISNGLASVGIGETAQGYNNPRIELSGTVAPTYTEGTNYVYIDEDGTYGVSAYEPSWKQSDFTGFGDVLHKGSWYAGSDVAVFAEDWKNWTAGVPDGWTVNNSDANNYVSETADGIYMYSDDTSTLVLSRDFTLTANTQYKLRFDIGVHTDGVLRLNIPYNGSNNFMDFTISTGSVVEYSFTPSADTTMTLEWYRNTAPNTDYTMKSMALFYESDDGTVDFSSATPIAKGRSYIAKVTADGGGNVEAVDTLPEVIVAGDVKADKVTCDELDYTPVIFDATIKNDDTGASPSTILQWDVVADTHNAFTAGIWVCPEDGYYLVSVGLYFRVNTDGVMVNVNAITSNGALFGITNEGTGTDTTITSHRSRPTYLNIGDVVYIETGGSNNASCRTRDNSPTYGSFSITKVGA